MSTSPELERLRALLMHEERGRVDELERRVVELQRAATETATRLPDVFNRSYADDARTRLIESMGPPVVDAAAQMASTQTKRTAQALAPVIFPAIASGVALELDRLSRRATAASPLAKMRWRREAQRTGIPVEVLASRDLSNTQVIEAWIFDCVTGELLAHYEAGGSIRRSAPDATAALLASLRAFVVEHGMSEGAATAQRLDAGNRSLWMVADEQIALAADLSGTSSDTAMILQSEFQHLHVSRKMGVPVDHIRQWLPKWAGEAAARFARKRATAHYWRAALALVVAALMLWAGVAWYGARVAAGLETQFADMPEVASVSARWQWQWQWMAGGDGSAPAPAGARWGLNWQVNLASDTSLNAQQRAAEMYADLLPRIAIRQNKFLSADRMSITTRVRESLSAERDIALQWRGDQLLATGVISEQGMVLLRSWPWALLGLQAPDVTRLIVLPDPREPASVPPARPKLRDTPGGPPP
jgi:hypothetical protein